MQLLMSHGAALGCATPCQALPAPSIIPAARDTPSLPPHCPHSVPTVLMLHFPASRTPFPSTLTSWEPVVLFHHRGHIPLPAGRGPRRGSAPASLLTSGIRDTRNLLGSIASACPPTEGTHIEGFSLLTCRWRGWSPRWDGLRVWGLWWHRAMAAPRATSGCSGHTGPVPAPCAGAAGGGRQGETEAGGAAWGGWKCHQRGDGATMGCPQCSFKGLLLIEGGTARWHQLLPLVLLQQLLQRCCIFCVWEDNKELRVTGLWSRSPPPPPSQGPRTFLLGDQPHQHPDGVLVGILQLVDGARTWKQKLGKTR